jgi:glycosyltransferase involved in cell wall biosynthesis
MNEDIGICLITYNRLGYLKQCIDALEQYNWSGAKYKVVVDDGSTEEGYSSYLSSLKEKDIWIIKNQPNQGVAVTKNKGMKFLYEHNCKHIFTIEDDILLKSDQVCQEYIKFCKENKLYHANFAWHGDGNKDGGYINPEGLRVYHNIIGAFSYVHALCIYTVGYMDENYLNATEHIDYTLMCSKKGLTTPFWEFIDIPNSRDLLEEIPGSIEGSSIRPRIDWNQNIQNSYVYFRKKWGQSLIDEKGRNIMLGRAGMGYWGMK